MIKIIEGNILDATENIICHQTNCLGIMGGGLAFQIRLAYPRVYHIYKEFCRILGKRALGTYQLIEVDSNKYIANIFGQYALYGQREGGTNYEALKISLEELLKEAKDRKLSIAIPYEIGCGLGGGDWKIVYPMIEEIFAEYGVTIYKFEP